MSRILIVDDEVEISFLVQVCLTREGHDVKTVKSRSEFLHVLPEFKPELIILDVMLGPDNGRNICKEMKATIYKSIPVILYSANRAVLENFEQWHANGVIAKPFNIVDLVNIVNKHLPDL